MKYKSEVLRVQYPLVQQFVLNAIYYRELHRAHSAAQMSSAFWIHTMDAHILQAIINWCMVFGAHGCNETHLKKLFNEDAKDIQNSFREHLFEQTELSEKDLNINWQSMTTFRNEYAAHRKLEIKCKAPKLDIPLKVAYSYDGWVRDIIKPDFLDFAPLSKYATNISKEVSPLIEKLLQAAKAFNQKTG